MLLFKGAEAIKRKNMDAGSVLKVTVWLQKLR